MPRVLDYTKINWEEEFSFDAPLNDIEGVITGDGPLDAGDEVVLCLRCRVDEVERYADDPDRWRASLALLKPVSIDTLSETPQLQLLKQLTSRLSAPLRQSELYSLFERFVTADTVTQIANRARFDALLEQEWLRGQRDKNSLSVILFQVHGLMLNEVGEGDEETDTCLRQIAAIIKSKARRSADLVARYQDNTFALLLPNTPQAAAAQLAGTIQKKVLENLAKSDAISHRNLTLNAGIAGTTPTSESSWTTLTEAAEQSLQSQR
ncbi:Phytochrome-like protein cph2 [Acaryochloris thomasi RCC1774]|uniref:Phytochrome-like protein cph2 n=1 Tax=Acaryochloris thomasi RCC1774 TaxID=1764569 RepID=A0A2W1JKG3_9CYAN|nr:diguanylate cyclase [Acaryochloris thomasi]PZD73859.1 Phytochrome-like protein cph2 [Acaryochloris thomasi RCC1774]